MKHNLKITLILLGMFLITQFIGLAVVNSYSPIKTVAYNESSGNYENITIEKQLPYGLEQPKMSAGYSLTAIITSMIVSIFLIFILMRFKHELILRFWFFAVVTIALALVFNIGFNYFKYSSIFAVILAIPFSFYKVFKRNILIHNLTELLIYPGIAVVFVPILSIATISFLLILISVYDIYAVNYSGIMQKMAKYQINKIKIFSGFFIPYADKKTKEKIKFLKEKYVNKNIPRRELEKRKIKISMAILGGGDIVFPIITAGVVLRAWGFFPAIIVSIFACLGLAYLFYIGKKGKFYPAMPFITAGCLIGLTLGYILQNLKA